MVETDPAHSGYGVIGSIGNLSGLDTMYEPCFYTTETNYGGGYVGNGKSSLGY